VVHDAEGPGQDRNGDMAGNPGHDVHVAHATEAFAGQLVGLSAEAGGVECPEVAIGDGPPAIVVRTIREAGHRGLDGCQRSLGWASAREPYDGGAMSEHVGDILGAGNHPPPVREPVRPLPAQPRVRRVRIRLGCECVDHSATVRPDDSARGERSRVTMRRMDALRLTEVATALGSPTRARMVCALLSGTAHTGRELARHVSVAPSTASEHLSQLVAAGLVTVEAQGRHRYFRLAGQHVAQLLESMMIRPSDAATPIAVRPIPSGLAFARSCYDHLAGELGVRLCDRLIALDVVRVTGGVATITDTGRQLLADLDIPAQGTAGGSRPAVRTCLDWSQRRHHLAGAVGARLLETMLERRWLYRSRQRRRELRLSDLGRRELRARFGVETP
jgi:DNA-binding transcriptional ArsR family regulator